MNKFHDDPNRRKGHFQDADHNPCLEEADLSKKCLENELYNYEKCIIYFDNYRKCKRFWGYIKKQRAAAGISPAIPTKVERDKILKLKKEGFNTISASD